MSIISGRESIKSWMGFGLFWLMLMLAPSSGRSVGSFHPPKPPLVLATRSNLALRPSGSDSISSFDVLWIPSLGVRPLLPKAMRDMRTTHERNSRKFICLMSLPSSPCQLPSTSAYRSVFAFVIIHWISTLVKGSFGNIMLANLSSSGKLMLTFPCAISSKVSLELHPHVPGCCLPAKNSKRISRVLSPSTSWELRGVARADPRGRMSSS
mmetsp:Transcript_14233/g.36359  ORF Transcript_14233/g.36359 Transcript_14233/m.36359 type:complete len:210 (+) Transcript_14233:847-1476(+)